MQKQLKSNPGFFLILGIILLACSVNDIISFDTSSDEPPPTPLPTVDANTPVPDTPVPQEAEPQPAEEAAPEPAPAVNPTAAGLNQVDGAGVFFAFDPAITAEASFETRPASIAIDGGPSTVLPGVPDYRIFNFSTTRPSSVQIETIRDEAGQYYPAFQGNQLAEYEALTAALNDRPVPVTALALELQPRYLNFQNGRGVRYLTVAQDSFGPVPVTNSSIIYVFRGLTDDGRHLVTANIGLATALLPNDESGFTDNERTNYDAYLADITSQLAGVPEQEFNPNLAILDALVQSIRVEDALGGEPEAAEEAVTEPVVINESNVTQLFSSGELEQPDLIRSLSFSPDGQFLVSSAGNQTTFSVNVWDVNQGLLLNSQLAHTGIVWEADFSADGNAFASVSDDKTVRIWNTLNGSSIGAIEVPSGTGFSLDYAPTGDVLAIGGLTEWPNAKIWLFNTSDNSLRYELSAPQNVANLTFTPDGTLLAGGGTDRTVRLWRVSDGALLTNFEHVGQVYDSAFSPDGQLLANGLCSLSDSANCTAGQVWVWRVSDGGLVYQLEGHSDRVSSVAFSPDGSLLAAGSHDDTISIWRVSDGARLHTITGPTGVNSVAFSPDGTLLASGDDDTILFWQVGEAEQ